MDIFEYTCTYTSHVAAPDRISTAYFEFIAEFDMV